MYAFTPLSVEKIGDGDAKAVAVLMVARHGGKIHHPLGVPSSSSQRHREEKNEKRKCGVYFVHGNTVAIINATVSWRKAERGRRSFVCCSLSSFSMNFSKRGCGNYGCRYSGRRNSRNIFTAGRIFSVPLCLERSGW
jgi:hypothetical protein